jgi:hypothetical protein
LRDINHHKPPNPTPSKCPSRRKRTKPMPSPLLRRRIILHNPPHLPIIRLPVLLVCRICIRLRRAIQIRLIKQRLYAQQNLLQRYGGLPAGLVVFGLLIKDGQTDGAAGVNVWVV